MKNTLFLFAALLAALLFTPFIATPVTAQQVRIDGKVLTLRPTSGDVAPGVNGPDEHNSLSVPLAVRHFTLELMQSPEGREALRKYSQMKATGMLPPARKGAMVPPIGTIRTFKVVNATTQEHRVDEIEFIKKAEGPLVDIWVEIAEIDNDHVRQEDIDRILFLASHETPGGFNPMAGIVENDEAVFGLPPNVDGDGILDVLLLDIRDGFTGSGGAILGFFDPVNLTGRNNADIVHLDTFPTLVDAQGNRGVFDEPGHTLAHEYEHLIWAIGINGGDDETFINEGMAEWGEVLNGFTARRTRYLGTVTEHAQPLLGWRGIENPLVLNDYQRAGLFSNYIADRIGILPAGAIAQRIETGIGNYEKVLTDNGLALGDVVLDFHTANLLNDRLIDPAFGYTVPQYASVKVSSIQEIDGTGGSSSPPAGGTLQPGAVFYTRWNNVSDIQIDVAGDAARVSGRFVLESFSGVITVVDVVIGVGSEGNFLAGDFAAVTMILTNVDFSVAVSTAYSFSSSWQSGSFIVQEIIYDDGNVGSTPDGGNAFLLGPGFRTASRFNVPPLAQLFSVKVDHVYQTENPDSTVPDDAPRDFTLHIWADDGQGAPGDEILAIEVVDTTPIGFVSPFEFMTVPLGAHAAELSNLPAVIYVGVGDAGTDDNNFVMTVSAFPVGISPSLLFVPGGTGWIPFTNLRFGTTQFDTMVLPIRAEFLIPTGPVAVDDPVELPAQVTLHQNYPNPFNPSTTIEFSLPESGNVRLLVYDMLGRRVATVVDEFRSVGAHQITFDASNLASGLYLYSLESNASKITRTMTLLR